MKAFAPNGLEILGTYEMCPCRAEITQGSFKREADGSIEFDYYGETEMFYDAQKIVKKDGECLYLDSDGNEWKESELVLREDDEDEAGIREEAADKAERRAGLTSANQDYFTLEQRAKMEDRY